MGYKVLLGIYKEYLRANPTTWGIKVLLDIHEEYLRTNPTTWGISVLCSSCAYIIIIVEKVYCGGLNF